MFLQLPRFYDDQVTAALVDSAVDLVSQAVLSLAESYMQRHSPDYPVGKIRIENNMNCKNILNYQSRWDEWMRENQ